MATISKRGRFWRVMIRRKGNACQYRTFDSKSEAQAWAAEAESHMRRGVFYDMREAERTSVATALQRFIDEYGDHYRHPRREQNRAWALQASVLGTLMLAAVRTSDIAKFIRSRSEAGANGSTVHHDLALLSRMFNMARTDWGMDGLINPVRGVTKPKKPRPRHRRFNTEPTQVTLADGTVREWTEEQRLLGVTVKPFDLVIRWALETAMRRGEIAELRWAGVDRQRHTALVQESKNAEPRTVPLSPAAMQILDELRSAKTVSIERFVFGMSPMQITDGMRSACERAGIVNLRFHDLRHEAISRLFERTDLDPMEIMKITGHKTFNMLAGYTHLRTERLVRRLSGGPRIERSSD